MELNNEVFYNLIDSDGSTETSTKTAYKNRLARLLKITGSKSIYDLLLSPDEYDKEIKKAINNSQVRTNLYICIITCMRLAGLKKSERVTYNKWYKLMLSDKRVVREQVESNKPTERQEEAHIGWDDILKIRDKLEVGSLDHVLVSMYTCIPPRRAKDYAVLHVYEDPSYNPSQNHNYIHLGQKLMYIHEFKTVKKMKPYWAKNLPNELLETIRLSLKGNPRKYLFCQANGQAFKNEQSFASYANRRLKDVFNNPRFSITSFRHSYATYTYSLVNLTLGERSRAAYDMGHTLHKHLSYAYVTPSSSNPVPSVPEDEDEVCYEKEKSTGKMKSVNCLKLAQRIQAKLNAMKAAKRQSSVK